MSSLFKEICLKKAELRAACLNVLMGGMYIWGVYKCLKGKIDVGKH